MAHLRRGPPSGFLGALNIQQFAAGSGSEAAPPRLIFSERKPPQPVPPKRCAVYHSESVQNVLGGAGAALNSAFEPSERPGGILPGGGESRSQ